MKPTKPEPSKLNLRMPPALRAEAEAQAASMGVSLNAYCLLALRNFIPFTQRQTPRSTAASPARKPTPTQPAASSTVRSPAASTWPKTGRNDPCPCGSGRKWKHCHGAG